MKHTQNSPLRGVVILFLFLGIGFSSCSQSPPQVKNATGSKTSSSDTTGTTGIGRAGSPQSRPFNFCIDGPYMYGICVPTTYGADFQNRTEFQRDYFELSIRLQLSSISYKETISSTDSNEVWKKGISYEETISSTDSDEVWNKGFTLDVGKVRKNNGKITIAITLVNPDYLIQGMRTTTYFALYHPDGSLIGCWGDIKNVTDGVQYISLNNLGRVNNFLSFFELRDRRLAYITLPPITVILE